MNFLYSKKIYKVKKKEGKEQQLAWIKKRKQFEKIWQEISKSLRIANKIFKNLINEVIVYFFPGKHLIIISNEWLKF